MSIPENTPSPLLLVPSPERPADRAGDTVTGYFDQLRTPVMRYLLALGLPLHDAEEVVQETFLALFGHVRRGRPERNLRAWVFRVAHNQGLKRREANVRNLRLVVSDAGAADRRPCPAPDPEARAERRQERERVLARAQLLSETDRRCLYLRIEGLRYREIARVLDISLGGVTLSLRRSMATLAGPDSGT